MSDESTDVTRLLAQWRDGQPEAAEQLLPLVYDELRRVARSYLRKERSDHTLQPTALVHEAYLRLADRVTPVWQDRVHFYAAVAKVMRQILVDHARRHTAAKRGGDAPTVSIDDAGPLTDERATNLLDLDDALRRLQALDARKARIIELRFFGGLTIDECAQMMELSTPTVINETRKARAWLYKETAQGSDRGS